MAAEFDEYEELEKQIDRKGQENGARENGKDGRDERRRDRKEKHSSRDRDRRDKDGDRKSRHRSRSRSRERKQRRPDEERPRSDREHRRSRPDAEQQPYQRPKRERTPEEVRQARERERELAELDRDTRTVFAYNLSLKADERDVFEFFSQAGTVVDVRIIMDRNTRRSKGFAYIEFEKREDIATALALTGQMLRNQAVMVKSSEAEKNLAWEAQQQQQNNLAALQALAGGLGVGVPGALGGPCKLQVAGVHTGLSEEDLKTLFLPFGVVEAVTLQRDASGRSMGVGFVQYQNMADATKAMQALNGQDIAGSLLTVSLAAIAPTDAGGLAGYAAPESLEVEDDDGGGLKLTANARAALMSRLAGASGVAGSGANTMPLGQPFGGLPLPPPPAQAPAANPLALVQGMLGPSSPIPTACLLLKNMFDPTQETEPDWDLEIGNDVKEECNKYGTVVHIHVDRNSQGFVYLMFTAALGASTAHGALSGRWFAGRQILAEYQFEKVYRNYFKC